jgi:hypothetical protein
MHGAAAGSPMYLLEAKSGSSMGVVRMANVLGATAMFADTSVPVAA